MAMSRELIQYSSMPKTMALSMLASVGVMVMGYLTTKATTEKATSGLTRKRARAMSRTQPTRSRPGFLPTRLERTLKARLPWTLVSRSTTKARMAGRMRATPMATPESKLRRPMTSWYMSTERVEYLPPTMMGKP